MLFTKEIVVVEIINIGETIRNIVTRIDEDEQPKGQLEPSKHLKNKPGHQFDWMILSRAPSDSFKKKILETCFTKQLNPSLRQSTQ